MNPKNPFGKVTFNLHGGVADRNPGQRQGARFNRGKGNTLELPFQAFYQYIYYVSDL